MRVRLWLMAAVLLGGILFLVFRALPASSEPPSPETAGGDTAAPSGIGAPSLNSVPSKANPDRLSRPVNRHLQASLLLESGDLAHARTQLEKAIAEGQRVGEAHEMIGMILVNEGNHEEAIEHLTAALAAGGPEGNVHIALGMALRELGRFNELEEVARDLLAADADSSKGQDLLEWALVGKEDWTGLATYARELIASAPTDADAHLMLGTALNGQEEWEELSAVMTAAAKVVEDPENQARFLTRAGQASVRLRDYQTAVEHIRRSLELDPNQRNVRDYLQAVERALARQR